jgi:hypothetical protein
LGRYVQVDPRGILLDYSDPQRQLSAEHGLPIFNYGSGSVSGLNHPFGYVGQNPLSHSDPTGEGPILGSACLAAGAINTVASIANFGLLLEEIESIQANIDKLESGCPEEERSNTYSNFLGALKQEKNRLLEQFDDTYGPGVSTDGFFAVACLAAFAPGIP